MPSEFDIIFAGGGTTACVTAGRLLTADPSLKVLVVESGPHSRDVPINVQPARFIENLVPTSNTVTFHVARPSKHLNGRQVIAPCGKSVGGGSVVNLAAYVRGAASDYDDWANFGNEGWSSTDLLPLIKKIETFTPKADQPTHGYDGPMIISASTMDFGVGKQFLNVAKEYDPERAVVDDVNDLTTANAYSTFNRYIDPKTGKRCDAASGYLYPHSENPNLQILVGKRIRRVIIENGRAVGIEFTDDAASKPNGDGEFVTVRALRLVVLSAGSFGSPAILERSGIGASSVLEQHSVPLVVDLPGVGDRYHDHCGALTTYYASDEIDTMDDVWSDPETQAAAVKEWESNGTGKIAHNGTEAMLKMRPTLAELASTGSVFQSRWGTFFEKNPDKAVAIIAPLAGFMGDHSAFPAQKFISVTCYVLYPESTGSVHITSGDDANAPLDFDIGYLSKPSDVALWIMLYKRARELIRRMPSYRGEASFLHPQFGPGSAAACGKAEGPVPMNAPDIVYSPEDNKAIEEFFRNMVHTAWHALGTCAMKPRDQGGVIDSRLNVYGVEGLKVADMSICPSNVGTNTYSTALLIGEKAASIIAQDLGISISAK